MQCEREGGKTANEKQKFQHLTQLLIKDYRVEKQKLNAAHIEKLEKKLTIPHTDCYSLLQHKTVILTPIYNQPYTCVPESVTLLGLAEKVPPPVLC
jgi:hypothetical protein